VTRAHLPVRSRPSLRRAGGGPDRPGHRRVGRLTAAAIAVLALAVGGAGRARTSALTQAADAFRGRTIRIVVGSTAGGTFAAEARLLARHLPRHLPGSPAVVVEPTPGAGGLVAATLLARTVAPDGLTIGYFTLAPVMAQLLDPRGARFDARRFEFVGSPYADRNVCLFSAASGITSLEAWRQSPRPLKMGATVPDSIMAVLASLLSSTLSLPTQVVTGYRGATEVRLAITSDELDGACMAWSGVVHGWPSRSGITIVVQTGERSEPALAGVPLVKDVAETADARELLIAPLDAMAEVGRFYALPPGTPSDRRDVLRQAFLATMRDPAYRAEAEAAGEVGTPIAGDRLAENIRTLLELPARVADRLRQIVQH